MWQLLTISPLRKSISSVIRWSDSSSRSNRIPAVLVNRGIRIGSSPPNKMVVDVDGLLE